MLVSIVITNYNYGNYLAAAIDSALGQCYSALEVIVVDDGSVDNSREIIGRYGSRITAVLKQNGGQCSCFNSGFERSRGDVVIFLDADDVLLANAAALHAECMQNPLVVKSCGYMDVIDDRGCPTGGSIPAKLAPSGDYREDIMKNGVSSYKSSFTSGNAWSRVFLEKVLPLPENDLIGADGYLTAVDGLFGRIESIQETVAQYRVHGSNKGPINFRFDAGYMINRLQRRRHRLRYTGRWLGRLGYQIDSKQLQRFRDWKLVLMRYVLGLLGHQDEPVPSALELVSSPFRKPKTGFGTRLSACVMLALVRILPKKNALQLAHYLLLRGNIKRTRINYGLIAQRSKVNKASGAVGTTRQARL